MWSEAERGLDRKTRYPHPLSEPVSPSVAKCQEISVSLSADINDRVSTQVAQLRYHSSFKPAKSSPWTKYLHKALQAMGCQQSRGQRSMQMT